MLADELPPRTMPGSIANQAMQTSTRDDEHRQLAAEMKLYELYGSVTVCPPGASSTHQTQREEQNAEARARAAEKMKGPSKHNRNNGKAKTGHMNIVEQKTCYSFMLNGNTIKSMPFGDNKDKTLNEIVKYRNEYRKNIGYPPANY